MFLEAEISRFTGLFFMVIIEIVAGIGIGIATISLIVTAIHSKKQTKVSSASLILELLKPWRDNEDFKHLLSQISDPNTRDYDEKEIEEFLNHLEDIATLWKDGTLTENHIKEFFGSNLKSIRDDSFIQNYIKKWTDKNSDYYFVNLRKLIEKVNDWKI